MKNLSISRRQLLNSMGLGAGTLFLPSLMGDKAAQAATPKKLLVFYTQHGPVQQKWTMRQNGPATWNGSNKSDRNLETSFGLGAIPEANWSEILKPLYPLRNKLLVMEGLAMTSVYLDAVKNAHNAGTAHALTGAKQILNSGPFAQGGMGDSSIDQIVADKVADPNRIRNLFYTTGGWSPIARGTTEQRGEGSPIAAFDRLFPGSQVGIPVVDRVNSRRASVLSAVRGEYDQIAKKLGGEDKRKLENHFQLVNEMEKSLAFRSTEGGKCDKRPMRFTADGGEPDKVKQFGNLITAAFACDMTRVATMTLGQIGTQEAAGLLDIHQDLHLAVAHEAVPGNEMRMAQMTKYYNYLAKQFATVLQQLDAVQVDGSRTVLDDTVCLWLCELANGPHEFHDIMAVMAGGGGQFSMGRYVKFAETNTKSGMSVPFGPSHNKLLVSVMQAMGLEQDSIGISSGSVSGKMMDLKGPLPMLKV